MFSGHVTELWRHPVKSMRGDRVSQATITGDLGVPGDRGWAVRDETNGEIQSGKRIPSLLQCHARYWDEPAGGSTPPVEITFPDGDTMSSDDERIDNALSETLARPVSLWPRQPADDYEHYRRRSRVSDQDLRAQLDLGPDDPFPDFSTIPQDVLNTLAGFVTPPGTYFDALPISLVTSTSLDSLAALSPDSTIDSRRFRKNIIVAGDSTLTRFPEFDWVGHQVRIGSALFEVAMPISRCVMVVVPQAELPHDRPILRSLVNTTDMTLGVYLRVLQPGEISHGDTVEVY